MSRVSIQSFYNVGKLLASSSKVAKYLFYNVGQNVYTYGPRLVKGSLSIRITQIHTTHAQSDPGICSPLIYSIMSNDSVSGQLSQSDLGLRCPHMHEDTVSHGTAQITGDKFYEFLFAFMYTNLHLNKGLL